MKENKWNLQQHAVETWGSNGKFGYVSIGDANMSQGAGMAMEEALVVAEGLVKQPEDVVLAFKQFKQRRVSRVNYIVNTSFSIGKIAQLENTVLASFRNMFSGCSQRG